MYVCMYVYDTNGFYKFLIISGCMEHRSHSVRPARGKYECTVCMYVCNHMY